MKLFPDLKKKFSGPLTDFNLSTAAKDGIVDFLTAGLIIRPAHHIIFNMFLPQGIKIFTHACK